MAEVSRIDFPFERPGTVAAVQRGNLRRLLGVTDLFAIGYGDVASSIYYALGVTIAIALGAAPLALLVTGFFFYCTVNTYAELSTAIPEAGGSQLFARRAFNDLVSFLAGWALLLDYVLTIAISAYTIAPYLGYFWEPLKAPAAILGFASLIIGLLVVLNIIGIRESTGVSIVLALFEIATLSVIVTIGAVYVLDWNILKEGLVGREAPSVREFLYSLPIAMVAYTGIEAVSQMAGEVRDPGRKVPRAMFLTMIPVILFGVLLSAIAVCAMTPATIKDHWIDDTLSGVVQAMSSIHEMPEFGRHLAGWVAILAAVILFIATNAGVIGASRLAYSMASTYQLPPWVGRLHPRRKTPVVALCLFPALAIVVLLLSKDLKTLADLYSFGAMLAFTLAHLSLIGLRVREPDLPRPFLSRPNFTLGGRRIPVLAILGALATGGSLILVVLYHERARNLGLAWCVLGLFVYVVYRRRSRIPLADRLAIEKIEMPEFAPLSIRKVLVPTLGGRSTEVVQHACAVAREFDAELTLLYVIEVPETLPLDTIVGAGHYLGQQALSRAEAIAREAGVRIVRTRMLQSRRAGETIVEVAKEMEADLVLLGAAPRRMRGASTLSPTIEHVMRTAPCRVWIANAPAAPGLSPPVTPAPETRPHA